MSRIVGKGVTFEMDLVIDIQSEIYPIKQGEKFVMAIASTLDMEGKPDDGTYLQTKEPTLLDKFDYGMYGRVFKYEYEGERVAIYASFGGLLMKLVGAPRNLTNIDLDSKIYVLIKKTESDAA